LKTSIFTRIKHLSLTLDGRLRFISIEHLQTIVNLSSIDCLSFLICLHTFIDKTQFIDYLSLLFKRTSNIRTLKLTYMPIEESLVEIEVLRAILPESIRHLHISIVNFEQMKSIVENFDQLLSVTFSTSEYFNEITEYLNLIRKNSIVSFGSDYRSIQIWLGTLIKSEKDKSPLRKFFRRFWH